MAYGLINYLLCLWRIDLIKSLLFGTCMLILLATQVKGLGSQEDLITEPLFGYEFPAKIRHSDPDSLAVALREEVRITGTLVQIGNDPLISPALRIFSREMQFYILFSEAAFEKIQEFGYRYQSELEITAMIELYPRYFIDGSLAGVEYYCTHILEIRSSKL